MKRTISTICIGAALLCAVSCDLNLYPEGSITYKDGDDIVTGAGDLQTYEANILAWLRLLEYGQYDYTPDVMTDCFNATIDYGNSGGDLHRGTFNSSDTYVSTNWKNHYSAIKSYNFFLNGSRNVPEGLAGETAQVRGEAFFARAFSYMHLARHFGKAYNPSTASVDLCVPLVTKYDIAARPSRATVQEIYDLIRSDLDSAAVLLASVPGTARAQKPTIDAVNFLYARYFLDTRDWAEAAEYAAKVIGTGSYALSSTKEEMETEWLNDNGRESVVQYFASQSEGIGLHSWYYYEYRDNDGRVYVQEMYVPTKTVMESYEPGDLRFAQWFGSELTYHNGYYNDGRTDYYYLCKYTGNPALMTRLPTSGQCVKPFLLGEMYLTAAEGLFMAGDVPGAQEWLNALQLARGATPTAATMEDIKREWLRETIGEGLRMSCLKRWGDGFSGRPFQYEDEATSFYQLLGRDVSFSPDDYRFQWPIPTYEMQTNLNLVQNPGYSDVAE